MRQVPRTRIVALFIAVALLAAPAVAYADPESDVPTDTVSTAPPATVTPAAPIPAPVVIVQSCATWPERVVVGTPFDLTLNLKNATSRSAGNVVVSIGQAAAGASTTTPSGLTVLDTGNAKFLGTLKGQGQGTVTFRVMANPGTTPGALTIPVTVSFEHQSVRQEVSYTIGVVVERNAVLTVVTAELPETVMTGESFDASFEVGNASGYALSGVTLSVEASGAVVTDGSFFLGTMDNATTESIDVSITAEEAGPLEVVVVVSYLDDFGRPQTFRESRTVVVESSPRDDAGEPGTDEPTGEEDDTNWFTAFFLALFGLGS